MIIDREFCRRQTLPLILRSLSSIGPLCEVIRRKDHIELLLDCKGEPTRLKFSDEDVTKDEGFVLRSVEESLGPSSVPLCKGINCHRGCGCKCLVDFGYVDKESLPQYSSDGGCLDSHVVSFPKPEEDRKLFTLKTTRIMINDLLACFIQSFIDEAVSCAS